LVTQVALAPLVFHQAVGAVVLQLQAHKLAVMVAVDLLLAVVEQ
jgi:hypothetical protein